MMLPIARARASWWRRLLHALMAPPPLQRYCSRCESRLDPDRNFVCVFCALLAARAIGARAAADSRFSFYSKPPRTGYIDDDGTYHPAPDHEPTFDEHADRCARCRCERRYHAASGYIGRETSAEDRLAREEAKRRFRGSRPVEIPVAGPGIPSRR